MLPIECLGGDIFEEISETLLDSSPQMVVIVWEFLHFISSCLGIIGIFLVIKSEKSDREGKLEELEPFLAISHPAR